jgi:hypothetical protein
MEAETHPDMLNDLGAKPDKPSEKLTKAEVSVKLWVG